MENLHLVNTYIPNKGYSFTIESETNTFSIFRIYFSNLCYMPEQFLLIITEYNEVTNTPYKQYLLLDILSNDNHIYKDTGNVPFYSYTLSHNKKFFFSFKDITSRSKENIIVGEFNIDIRKH